MGGKENRDSAQRRPIGKYRSNARISYTMAHACPAKPLPALPPRALRHRRTDCYCKLVNILGVLEGGLNEVPEPVAYHHCDNGYSKNAHEFADPLRSISKAGGIDIGEAFVRQLQAAVVEQVSFLDEMADLLLSPRPAADGVG